MNLHWFLRMAQWVRNPPSATQVKVVLAIVTLCIVIAVIEAMGWWPDWATADRMRWR